MDIKSYPTPFFQTKNLYLIGDVGNKTAAVSIFLELIFDAQFELHSFVSLWNRT